eukprot:gene9453-12737_t
MSMSNNQSGPVNKPANDAFKQQRLPSWQPIMTPFKVVAIFIGIGVAFIPTGFTLYNSSKSIFQRTIMYDGSDQTVNCAITKKDANKQCQVTFNFDKDVDGPLWVYYELRNFYQNHRKYVSSRDALQLQGESRSAANLDLTCSTLVKNGSLILNPCGLIANSFFNDEFSLQSNLSKPTGLTLDESDISWPSDDIKFKQPSQFKAVEVSDSSVSCSSAGLPDTCKYYNDTKTNTEYLYYYPNDASTQYLYETYPNQISPIDGVEDEHFKVWMRTASLSTFRKLYGRIHHDFKKGDKLVFQISANFEVDSFDGSKSLVISSKGEFGGKNPFLGIAYIVVGFISLLFALLFLSKQLINPRAVADASLLHWNN